MSSMSFEAGAKIGDQATTNVPMTSVLNTEEPSSSVRMRPITENTAPQELSSNLTLDDGGPDSVGAHGWSSLGERGSDDSEELIDPHIKVSNAVKYYYLAMYFILNLVLTIHNKAVLQKFPCPCLLTTLHAFFGGIGCLILKYRGYLVLRSLSLTQFLIMSCFSMLYTVNIAMSNISLNLVSIPFHQVVRATTPIFAALIYAIFFRQLYPVATYLTLAPIIVGVGFATHGDYRSTTMGLVLTLSGALLAAVKTVVTNRLQTGRLQLSAFELLYYMSPCSFAQGITYSVYNGEITEFRQLAFTEGQLTFGWTSLLLLNGTIACCLNLVSFVANKKAGALTMTVAAQIKQIATIALSIVFFHLTIGFWNGFGIFLTTLGGALYARVEMDERRAPTASLPR